MATDKHKWKKILEEIMSDNKPRSITGIMDLMWENIRTKNKENTTINGRTIITGRNTIPTTQKMSQYMSKSPDYDSAVFDIINNKTIKSKSRRGLPYERRYWRVK
tara:strand:- start:107 stop:421 length:315 start_codon:yes stop_codon:yes gene_type:complete